ncbi:hypothetical protein CW358_03755 [Pseudomonas protegens]|uniref:metallophosphoesterase family protein n=1 Tax=Pseudomonas protegens TaxID=380021 RepID=UPI0010121D9A|nr:metallophosphoesterase [Pseudomonas protegens]RXU69790.1 hypothetical protein CW358_03755 [Pseudomonas protegens]
MSSINFLHISDLHVGLNGASYLWPLIREEFFKDLRQHLRAQGAIDFVIFSGDLTQSGSSQEFQLAVKELERLWNVFRSEDCNPQLFIIPGNHDVARPTDPTANVLTAVGSVRQRPALLPVLMTENEKDIRQELLEAHAGYMDFLDNLSQVGIPLAIQNHGGIPGDCVGIIEKDEFRVGLIGLNSTWSQLEGGDFFEKIDIYPRQLTDAIDGDVADWLGVNHYNFLVTHHPREWFNKDALRDFESNIDGLGRFDGHFFGHMHKNVNSSMGMGGTARKRRFQAASLFGLESGKNGSVERVHGYIFYKIDFINSKLISWPRQAVELDMGGWRINALAEALSDSGQGYNSDDFPVRADFTPLKKKII